MTPIAIKKLIVNKNMKHYNFDEVIERHGTSCVKFDRLKEMFGDENLIPLWVADMDFRTPDFIVEALKKRCEHEIFGYTFGSDAVSYTHLYRPTYRSSAPPCSS